MPHRAFGVTSRSPVVLVTLATPSVSCARRTTSTGGPGGRPWDQQPRREARTERRRWSHWPRSAVGGERSDGRSRGAALDGQTSGPTLTEQTGAPRATRSGFRQGRTRAGSTQAKPAPQKRLAPREAEIPARQRPKTDRKEGSVGPRAETRKHDPESLEGPRGANKPQFAGRCVSRFLGSCWSGVFDRRQSCA